MPDRIKFGTGPYVTGADLTSAALIANDYVAPTEGPAEGLALVPAIYALNTAVMELANSKPGSQDDTLKELAEQVQYIQNFVDEFRYYVEPVKPESAASDKTDVNSSQPEYDEPVKPESAASDETDVNSSQSADTTFEPEPERKRVRVDDDSNE